ncbi:hypothetical protein ACH79_15735 [Bradyrhizobium sp. CCBAU 051011]|uniref:FAD-dependent oxidoreductase n=1 Tax=Bradyrhizobium sp. CCBAU 051011 TaxID=858422 RepID=UPI001373949E|nr:FAD-dependent oxidoreductase [Bradyrhizobium sp. CCBAU 051011]QHO73886.1 hypothetical protein ACH79_15735 [Bradyrhizobium sp. CCBAU 051011]
MLRECQGLLCSCRGCGLSTKYGVLRRAAAWQINGACQTAEEGAGMRVCEIAVVGLGLIGSSAFHSLARRGADVLGFDPLVLGEARGSSHGSCRVYRRFNSESATYTELSDAAFKGWRMLEAASGRTILMPTRVLEAGPPGSKMVADSRASALKEAVSGLATGAEANAAFPAFQLPEEWDVVVQESGGILLAEAAIRAFR